jgi:hypothetical protein
MSAFQAALATLLLPVEGAAVDQLKTYRVVDLSGGSC